jgi:hypothetical protein
MVRQLEKEEVILGKGGRDDPFNSFHDRAGIVGMDHADGDDRLRFVPAKAGAATSAHG